MKRTIQILKKIESKINLKFIIKKKQVRQGPKKKD